MQVLPDELLLEVFVLLDWQDLLRGPRGVCRQWRRVALDPALWSARSISMRNDNCSAVMTALRVAPCLRSLSLPKRKQMKHQTTIEWCSLPPAARIVRLAPQTNCAISRLSIYFSSTLNEEMMVPEMETFLRLQVQLQQLTAITLDCVPASCTVQLVTAALEAPLSELEVTVRKQYFDYMPGLSAPRNGFTSNATRLTVFRYESRDPDPLVEDLIAPHTATLESLKLPWAATPRAVELACQCPRLRAVHLPCMSEVDAVNLVDGLGACPQLTDLALTIWNPFPQLIAFFRNTRGITKLSLFPRNMVHTADSELLLTTFVLGLIAELSSTNLKELCIGSLPDPHIRPDWPFSVFSRFPMLCSLQLGDVLSVDVMDAITPDRAPNLHLLSFANVKWEKVKCVPTYCFYPAILRLVKRNPCLHVVGLESEHRCSTDDRSWFKMVKYMPFLKMYPPPHCSLYGHEEKQACGVSSHSSGSSNECPRPDCGVCAHEWRRVVPDPSLSQ